MNKVQIEVLAKRVFDGVWAQRESVLHYQVTSPMMLLDPQIACQIHGIRVSYQNSLGSFGGKGDRFEVAGALDRQNKTILISERFAPTIKKFTLAHELGHWLMHQGEMMHRDRPIKGIDREFYTRPLLEQEADYFAAVYLMPKEAVLLQFKTRFGSHLPFVFNETSAFKLGNGDAQSLIYSEFSSLDRELALATCRGFGMNGFKSLAEEFGVSSETMAIRLRELELVRWP